MRYKVKSVLEGYLTSYYYFLEGRSIFLSYDGDRTYLSTDYLDIPGNKLDIAMQVFGYDGAAWKLKLVITKDEDPKYNNEKNYCGTIIKNQTDSLKETADL